MQTQAANTYYLCPRQFGFKALKREEVRAAQSRLLYDFEVHLSLPLKGWGVGFPKPPENFSGDLTSWYKQAWQRIHSGRLFLTEDFAPCYGAGDQPDLVSTLNPLYYSVRGGKMYKDMSTAVSKSAWVGNLSADMWVEHIAAFAAQGGQLPESIAMAEYGGGNGKNAADFLSALRRRSPLEYGRVKEYWLVDAAGPLVEEAVLHPDLAPHAAKIKKKVAADLSPAVPTDLPPMLLLSSEFYSDLPAQELFYAPGRFFEVWYRLSLERDAFTRRRSSFSDGKTTTYFDVYHVDAAGREIVTEDVLAALGRRDFEFLRGIKRACSNSSKTDETNPMAYVYPEFGYFPLGCLENYPHSGLILDALKEAGETVGAVVLNYAAFAHLKEAIGLARKNPGAAIFWWDTCVMRNLFHSLRGQFFQMYPMGGRSFPGKVTVSMPYPLVERFLKDETAGLKVTDNGKRWEDKDTSNSPFCLTVANV